MKRRASAEPIRIVQEFFYQVEQFVIEIDVDACTVSVSCDGQPAECQRAEDFASLCALYQRTFDRVTDERGGPEEFYDDCNQAPQRLDLGAEVERVERRRRQAAALGDRPPSRWHAMERAAHAAIARADLGSRALSELADRYDLDVSTAGLQQSFTYVIEIDRARAADAPLSLGTSKIGGVAHLPSTLAWPDGGDRYYLFAQLNVLEFQTLDVFDALPSRGFFYYFITESSRARLFYANCAAGDLAVVAPPASPPVPDYMRWLSDREQALSFRPNFYFDQGTDTHAVPKLIAALPADLRQELNLLVGNTTTEIANCKPGDRLFGGEAMDWVAEGNFLQYPLFAQFEAFNGNLYLAVDRGDLRAGYTADAQCTYRGT